MYLMIFQAAKVQNFFTGNANFFDFFSSMNAMGNSLIHLRLTFFQHELHQFSLIPCLSSSSNILGDELGGLPQATAVTKEKIGDRFLSDWFPAGK